MPNLYEEWTLRGVTFRNRIGVSPMCQYSSEDGFANDWHMVHLGSRAVGGAGFVMTEAAAVEPRGRISAEDLGIWKDEHIPMLKRITDFLRGQGAVSGIQLAHAGRKAARIRPWEGPGALSDADGGWPIVGPTATPFSDDFRNPRELTLDEIETIIEAFVDGTRRADEAGFDVIEIHAAHGYLLHSFYSPLANTRTDAYGGDFDGRTRMLREVARRIRAIWNKPLFVRLSATDWVEDGWTLDDSIRLAACLKEDGVDLIDCSAGGVVPGVSYPVGAGYQVPLAEGVKHGAGIMTAAVGMITEPMQADELIRNGRADMVLMAREFLRNPYWPLHAADVVHQSDAKAVPPQYQRAF